MIELEKEFIGSGDVRGFKFRQIKKNKFAFIYEVTNFSEDENINKINTYYEVFRRKISKESDGLLNNVMVHFESKEVYPRSNSFGIWAYCIDDYNNAILKFNEITDYLSNKL